MSVNKVILVGNLTRDAEFRQAGQSQVASFGVATSEKFKDRNGQMLEETEFHNCEIFGSEGVYPYLKKGQQVYIEGKIKTDKWTDQQGQARESKKIRVFQLQLVGSRPQQPAAPAPAPQQGYAPQGYQPQPQYPPQQGYAPAPQPQYQPQPAYQPAAAPAPAPQPAPAYQVPFPQSAPPQGGAVDDLP